MTIRKFLKSFFVFAAASLLSSASVFGASADIGKSFESFTDKMTEVLPETTTQLGVWSDAYIGKLFPSAPPHFGLGVTVAGTFIKTKEFSSVAEAIVNEINGAAAGASKDFNFSIPNTIPFPAYSVNARLGGIVLPFDVGLYGSYLKINSLKFEDFTGTITYYSFGGDIRYAVMKGSTLLPKISVGAGYIYTHMALGVKGSSTYDGMVGSIPASVTANTDMNTNFDLHTLFVQAQVSKKFFILTPYAGMRAYVTASKSHYDYAYASTYEVGGVPQGNVPNGSGGEAHDYNSKGFAWGKIQPQLYAGLGLNIFFFDCTLGGCWNPRNNLWSANVSARFKL
ncbi:hypothetical protein IZU27_05825 [Treponema socranskii]|uniref:hypothetical protein n=1 Tax=Treponema socranskii TaxID=53419 RepID=UPI003D910347